jgi:GT2 family glycosyltransferase
MRATLADSSADRLPYDAAPLLRFRGHEDLTAAQRRAGVSLFAEHRVRSSRPRAQGKFLFVGDEKLYVRGVTYGTFRPGPHGEYVAERVEHDFALMARNGINAVRTYSVPPRFLLDLAQEHGLFVMVGLPWEQHVAFLDDRRRAADIVERVRHGVRACAGHPAVLAYAIGNEIPASIVRWSGPRAIERFLERLHEAARAADPGALCTYVNFPSTEYLQLGFVDFFCFNVYLEAPESLTAYLARLQSLADSRPLVIGEIGLDSRRNGQLRQARSLDGQVRAAFAAGCAGAFVFSWTDEWHRGGHDIEDWDFGLTTREQEPKPALASVREAFDQAPLLPDRGWPKVSVVVCSYNGERTIGECLEHLQKLSYPDYEIIVIDDGSTDSTPAIAAGSGVRLLRYPNGGLARARNHGLQAAMGEIVAYIDDDAYPDPHWLTYLAAAFRSTTHAAIGGPNLPPGGDGPVSECVANAPGGPVHVLVSDEEAEHVPGCNMAFRKSCLEAIGGFDPQFRTAGDDVDICWSLQKKGFTIGFHPAALVWHHRRGSIRAYWKQQKGYGMAEALLERKWPEKYNAAGHLRWAGRVYGKGFMRALSWRRPRIHHGHCGSAPFQSLYEPGPQSLAWLPLMPEWYLVSLALALICLLGLVWRPAMMAAPLLTVSLGLPAASVLKAVSRASFSTRPRSRVGRLGLQSLTASLHVIQPLARLCGRLRHGLTPWRALRARGFLFPRSRAFQIWSERGQEPSAWATSLETSLASRHPVVRRGGDFDSWDLELPGGLLGSVRARMAIEEHGAGRQLLRLRVWPRYSPLGLTLTALLVLLSVWAGLDRAGLVSRIFAAAAGLLVVASVKECGLGMAAFQAAIRHEHHSRLLCPVVREGRGGERGFPGEGRE